MTRPQTLVGIVSALALMGVSSGSAAAQDVPLTYPQMVSCTAMFLELYDTLDESEKNPFVTAAPAFLLQRAQALGAARNLTNDQVVREVVRETIEIEAQFGEEASTADKRAIIIHWGPGLDRCLYPLEHED
jgi:hypothetical protein